MYTLYHHPFCPHSRFIRLVLGEHGLDLRLVEERAWERREGFLVLNPAAATPVLLADGFPPIPGAGIEEFAEIFAGVADSIGIGHAEAIEAERLRFTPERGLQIGGGEFDGLVQKSRST